jgi:hypothetical protein
VSSTFGVRTSAPSTAVEQARLAQHVVRRGRQRRARRAAEHELGLAAADQVGDVGVPVADGLRLDLAAAQPVRVQIRLQRAPHEQRRELERSRLLGGVDDRVTERDTLIASLEGRTL